VTETATPRGPASVTLTEPATTARSLLVLGHGAGGGVDAPDLGAVTKAALAHSVAVALVTQPYRVAGRRSPAPAAHLDEAWTAVVAELRSGPLGGLPVIVGGRSSGARVACRTAIAVGASGIVALAFPLHPPGKPERSRDAELDTGLPTLVVNGDRDPFGVPEPRPGVTVCLRPGLGHDLRGDLHGTAAVVIDWMRQLGWAAGPSRVTDPDPSR
jgi:predicted alpha/beta-hydrolase family hydrolase